MSTNNVNIKTWIIYSQDETIKVGSKVRLKLNGSDVNLWLSNNTVKSKDFNPAMFTDGDTSCNFIVYALDDNINRVPQKFEKEISNGMIIGLYCEANSFLSVNTDGSLTNNVSNNQFLLYAPDIIDKDSTAFPTGKGNTNLAWIKNKTAVQLYYDDLGRPNHRGVLALKNLQLKVWANDFDDDYIGVNYPFIVMSVTQHNRLGLKEQELIYCGGGRCPEGNGGNDSLNRFTPPPGYACFGDVYFVNRRINNIPGNKDYFPQLNLIFCKIDNPSEPDNPFCKKVIKSGGRIGDSNLGAGRNHRVGDYRFLYPSGGEATDTSIIIGESPDSLYTSVGTAWQNTDSLWAVRNIFVNKIPSPINTAVGSNDRLFSYNEPPAGKGYQTRPSWNKNIIEGGRMIYSERNFNLGDNYKSGLSTYWYDIERAHMASIASIVDRRPAITNYDRISDNTAGNWIWLTPQQGAWSDYRNDAGSFINGLTSYLFITMSSLIRSCYEGGSQNIGEIGPWELGLVSNQLYCGTLYKKYCDPDIAGSDITSNFCQTVACTKKNDPDRLCNGWQQKFCNKKEQKDGVFIFPNYDKYPDMCACFMKDKDFSEMQCDKLGASFNIQKGDYVKRKALNIAYDYNNPTFTPERNKEEQLGQCRNPREYNSDQCKPGRVKRPLSLLQRCSATDTDCYSVVGADGGDRYVYDGTTQPFSEFTRTVCSQDVSVDIQGKLGKLNVSQLVENCGNASVILTRKCISGPDTYLTDKTTGEVTDNKITVVFSPATGTETDSSTGNILFSKTIIDDSPPGVDPFQCGVKGDKRYAVVFKKNLENNKYEFSDTFTNGIRRITYKIDKTNISKPFVSDIKDALKWFAERNPSLDKTMLTSSSFIVNADKTEAYIDTNYTDCIEKLEPNGECELKDGRWKQPMKRIYTEPTNGGKACIIDTTPVFGDCTTLNDCVINNVPSYDSNACYINTDGSISYNIEFPIVSHPSGDGLSCKGVTDKFLTNYKKDKFGTILPDVETKDNKVIVKYECKSCPLEYDIQGECEEDLNNNKYYITKVVRPLSIEQLLSCSDEQKNKYDTQKIIKEECSGNCQFNIPSTPEKPIGICNLGKKVTTFEVTNRGLGGASCDIVSVQAIRNLSNLYNIRTDKFKYNPTKNVIELTEDCEMPMDCAINYNSAKEGVCSSGNKTVTYDIVTFEKAGGIGCMKLMMNHENIQDETKVTIDEPNYKINVIKSCPVEQPTISTTQNPQGNTTTTIQKPSGDTTQVTTTPKGDTIIQTTSGTGDKTTTVRDSSGNVTSKTNLAPSKSNNTMIIIIVIIILLLLGIGALLFLKK